ncbi:MAG: MarR family winged helix-turn-helix transcriptional regulator [Acidimicrobiales bacterium]
MLGDLHRAGTATIADVRGSFGGRPSTLAGVLDRLELRGFVERAINQGDRRTHALSLTKVGTQVAARVAKGVRRLDEAILELQDVLRLWRRHEYPRRSR